MVVYSNREQDRPKQSNRKQSNRKREPARRPLHTLCVAQHIKSASEGGRAGRAGAGTAMAPEGAKQDRPNESKTKANKQQAEPKTKTKQANPARVDERGKGGQTHSHGKQWRPGGLSGRWDCEAALHTTKRKGARTGNA